MDALEENKAGSSSMMRRSAALGALLPATASTAAAQDDGKQPTLEEKYERRFPQRVHVSDVLGKPILDNNNAVVGYVQKVVQTRAGKIEFIVPYGGLFGWGRRLVAVPIETLASIGTALVALDFPKEKFRTAPTWYGLDDQVLGPDAEIRVAVTRH